MKTVLVVDDEYALVENLSTLLESAGYRVVSAGNGDEGLEHLRTEIPDLVITDFMMPIIDGRGLVLGMRERPDCRSVPIIMMSATIKAVALADGSGGVLDVSVFLQKPVTWEKLHQTVIKLIGDGEKEPRA